MALQLWLPFNGDLMQQGLSDISLSGNSSFINEGKIGKAISFGNGSDVLICETDKLNFANDFSFSAWIKFTYIDVEDYPEIFSIGNGYGLIVTNTNEIGLLINGISVISIQVDETVWNHIAVTKLGSKITIFVNGEQTQEYDIQDEIVYSIDKLQIGKDFLGNINDLRIYDHCLSLKEIKDIYKCLILHYKLDEIKDGGIIYDYSGYGHHGTVVGDAKLYDNSPKYQKSVDSNRISASVGGIINFGSFYLEPYYTISLWCNTYYAGLNYCLFDLSNSNRDFIRLFYNGTGKIGYQIKENNSPIFYNYPGFTPNVWYNIVLVVNRNHATMYFNGEKKYEQTLTRDYLPLLVLNGRIFHHIEKNNHVGARMSDLRIYHTPFSDEDILDLYRNSATVDADGNICCYEFVEDDTVEKITVGKNSIIKCDEIIEDDNGAHIFNNNTISGNHLYEI